MDATEQKAINHAIVLKLANYSKVKMRQIENLPHLLETSDINWLNYNLSKIFKVEPSIIETERLIVQKAYTSIKEPFHILHVSTPEYPKLLKKTPNPPQFLYCRGDLQLFNRQTIAVVGSRAASAEGLRRAKKLSRLLARAGYTIVSGLAKGVDTMGHTGAIEEGGKTISVIGTPLGRSYPKENRQLQEQIATDHLLVSQFHPGHPVQGYNFATRNYTTSGISLATVIVEAGETSGTLIQARQCMSQGRHLFLLKNLLDRKDLTWPKKYVNKGAFVVGSIEDILPALQKAPQYRRPEEEQTLFK